MPLGQREFFLTIDDDTVLRSTSRPAACLLLFRPGDKATIEKLTTEAQEKQDGMLFEYLARLTKQEGETEMKATESELEKPSYWQLVFLQSKVNGAAYTGEELPGRNWDWPKNTYLQRRLRTRKFFNPMEHSKLN